MNFFTFSERSAVDVLKCYIISIGIVCSCNRNGIKEWDCRGATIFEIITI